MDSIPHLRLFPEEEIYYFYNTNFDYEDEDEHDDENFDASLERRSAQTPRNMATSGVYPRWASQFYKDFSAKDFSVWLYHGVVRTSCRPPSWTPARTPGWTPGKTPVSGPISVVSTEYSGSFL